MYGDHDLSAIVDAAVNSINATSSVSSPLARRLEEWKHNAEFRKQQDLVDIQNFLWNNAAFMDVNAVWTFQNLSDDGKVRCVRGIKSLAHAYAPSALIRAMAGEDNRGGGKKRKESANPWEPAFEKAAAADYTGTIPHFHFLTVAESCQMVKCGYRTSAPCMAHEKHIELFNEAHSILADAVGDMNAECIFEHDPENAMFPEVDRANREAGGEENCHAIGIAPGRNVWAVGMGSGHKGREKAVKLSLAVAIAFESPETATRLCTNFNAFAAMWKQLTTGTALDPWYDSSQSTTPQVHLLQLTIEDELVKQGMPAQGYSLAWSKPLKEIFSTASHVLMTLLPETSSVEYIDDPDWNDQSMKGIGEAIERSGAEKMSFTVAVCKVKNCWAVGLGGSKKNRTNAAKLALALVLGQAEGRLLEACAHYAEFCSLCTAAGLITPEQAENANRHRQLQEGIWAQQQAAKAPRVF